MSSASSVAAPGSRSPSPSTPEALDSFDPVTVQSDLDFYNSGYLASFQQLGAGPQWDITSSQDFIAPKKVEDTQMLHLDDLIEQHAYDDSASANDFSSLRYSSPLTQLPPSNASPAPSTSAEPIMACLRPNNLAIPSSRHAPISATKPIPPPASLPRKQDPSTLNQRVVYPPKESCFNLPIMVPSIPEGGTKSRVETQVRVTVDLADASSSSDPYRYDRVGSWKWLKLPQGTATKRRTRKQGKIDPDPQDVLHLSVSVTCASPPHNRVLSCSSCQTREAKRVAKKLAARVRPARSDTDSGNENPLLNRSSKGKYHEDTTSIIQFNCAEILDFSSGSAVLPLRITCYCRHHREKVGFNVHFTMMDCAGRIVGTGSSRPIMITDDHKTAPSANALRQAEYATAFMNIDTDWNQLGAHIPEHLSDSRAPSKRKKDNPANVKRVKPYDSSSKPNRGSREGSVASVPSPPAEPPSLPMTRSPTPTTVLQQLLGPDPALIPQQPSLQHSSHTSDSSSSDTLITPLDRSPDLSLHDAHKQQEVIPAPSPLSLSATIPSVVMPTHPHPMPFVFFDPSGAPANLALQVPIIHRLIPSIGPTHGGIEVTVLGANFHASLQLNCIFGEVPASSTQRWSDNTLVCVLPPRAAAGVVAVWFDGFPKMMDQPSAPPSLFTYSDESDRALMELALQVVGLKMTGKIEDAKNVAMRIVGGAPDGSDSQNNGSNTNMMQLASSITSTRDLRPQLLNRAGGSGNFESMIVDFLSVLDVPLDKQPPMTISTAQAISHATSNGQTLLHLAAFLGFSSLVTFLVKHDIDLDARDRNGYTAVHFAVLSKSTECVRALLSAGADCNIVNSFGKTPAECTTDLAELFEGVSSDPDGSSDSDEEADWGDAEEDGYSPVRRPLRKRPSRRRNVISAKSTPSHSLSPEMSRSGTPLPDGGDVARKDDKKVPPNIHDPDAKQAASFIELIQRTLAQLPAPQGIIPNMAQLPLPHLPLKDIGMPAVPWGALPQIPVVFPVYVPMMPGWPAFFGGEHQAGTNIDKGDGAEAEETLEGEAQAGRRVGGSAMRTAQEWRATWEKWFALAVAVAKQEEMPPPMYTPREGDVKLPLPVPTPTEAIITVVQEEIEPIAGPSTIPRSPSMAEIRPVGYTMEPMPEQEVNAYGYQPSTKQAQKLQKKHDKMLLIFWLPILLLSLLWAIHTGIQFTYQTLKTVFPKTSLIIN